MRRRAFIIGLAGFLLAGAAAPLRKPKTSGPPARSPEDNARYPDGSLVFFACQPGRRTLDGSVTGPGNPFATAFVALIADRQTDLQRFSGDLYEKTLSESRGFQIVDAPPRITPPDLAMSPAGRDDTRLAMVLVVTQYRDRARLPELAGARRDANRIATALRSAGYKTTMVLDADMGTTEEALARFGRETRDADVAIIYTTGHGLEVGGEPYILMHDFDLADGPDGLKVRALPVAAIARAMKAKTANVLFSAACRDNPLGW